jgi:phytoene dehydrogenase-like protein
MDFDVVIIGAGITGLSCAVTLQKNNLSCAIVEAGDRLGGRIKTDRKDGYLLDYGFQVLQTGYPEVPKVLEMKALKLKKFPSGVAVRYGGEFHIIADPRRHPEYLLSTLLSKVGTLRDRFIMLRLVRSVCRGDFEEIFKGPEEKSRDFLRRQGFSEKFIKSFFVPFFAGACLDPAIQASSYVLQYIFRVFASGDATLPEQGMEELPAQLAALLPQDAIRFNSTVTGINDGLVTLQDGRTISGKRVVVATSQPDAEKLMARPSERSSVSESCLYFSADWRPPFKEPFLVLNGEGKGPINNIAFPSLVAPSYSTSGKTLIAAIVLAEKYAQMEDLEAQVRSQCHEWFGDAVKDWEHLQTYHIPHALPNQEPPVGNPYILPAPVDEKLRICGEFQGVPGLQWSLLSGRKTAEAIVKELF